MCAAGFAFFEAQHMSSKCVAKMAEWIGSTPIAYCLYGLPAWFPIFYDLYHQSSATRRNEENNQKNR
jgi:hypothetical protein